MDGVHDLGGRLGFGPVDVHEPEVQFHHAWEARALAIIRAMARPVPWSLDWFRHVRELIDPVEYLSREYYDQWIQTYAAMLVDAGAATVAEIAGGKAAGPPPAAVHQPMMRGGDVAAATTRLADFRRADVAAPHFAVGDRVRAKDMSPVGHTRLPQYVRGHRGKVAAIRGGFVFPDANLKDDAPGQMLYTVAFPSSALWPEAAGSRDSVHVDLWESYLEPA